MRFKPEFVILTRSMRGLENMTFTPKVVSKKGFRYQMVVRIPIRTGAEHMYKTVNPRLPLVDAQVIQELGFSVERIVERINERYVRGRQSVNNTPAMPTRRRT